MSVLRSIILISVILIIGYLASCTKAPAEVITLDSGVVLDKIKGGWVGQTVACTYGGPTEMVWTGTWIPEYVPIEWNENSLIWNYENVPGLYDDIYMDMAFVAVLDSLGLDASTEAMAFKFAHAGFRLWHANQAARWNILNGIMPPSSGHYKNNPHADCIDFQIESDFIGLIAPGMPVTALEYADRIGHIMNYGDGFYGGVFVSAMYCHAFMEEDIVSVVEKALRSLPPQSGYARCIRDAIDWWRKWPDDWHNTWFELQKKWSRDMGCPRGVFLPRNLDASINGAYVVVGLLYGGGDFGRTIDISTRCGQDSDCNPATAAGILGTLVGFEKIPAKWKLGLDKVEHLKFSHSNYSLKEVYEVTRRLAAETVRRQGGSVEGDIWTIKTQVPQPPEHVEVSFDGLTPYSRQKLRRANLDKPFLTTFQGRAFVLHGELEERKGQARCEVLVDGQVIEDVLLKGSFTERRTPLFWNYDLSQGTHRLEVRQFSGDGRVELNTLIVYR
jgi:ADP-ribosylglycohydrolase